MGKLKVGRLMLGICQTNCYFIYREGSQDVIFFDPADKGDYIYETLKDKGFQVKGILLTHGHFDHIWGVNRLKELSGAPLYAYEAEKVLCEDAVTNVSDQVGRPYTVDPDRYLKDNEEITIADMTCRMIATPGHTVGRYIRDMVKRQPSVTRRNTIRSCHNFMAFLKGYDKQAIAR